MAKSRFNPEQKIAALKMAKAGKSITDVCCEYKISNATFFAWRRKFKSKDLPSGGSLERDSTAESPQASDAPGAVDGTASNQSPT